MPGPMGGGMRGPGRRMQGGTRIENPGKVFKRLMAYIFKNYGIHFIFVLVCIVLSVVASIQGTLFIPGNCPCGWFLSGRCGGHLCLQPYHGNHNSGNTEESP